jgi:hypothetical protein
MQFPFFICIPWNKAILATKQQLYNNDCIISLLMSVTQLNNIKHNI